MMKKLFIILCISILYIVPSKSQDVYIGSWYVTEIPTDELLDQKGRDVYNFRSAHEEIVIITESGRIGSVQEIKLFNWSVSWDRWASSKVKVGYYDENFELVDSENITAKVHPKMNKWLMLQRSEKFLDYMFLNTGYIRVVTIRTNTRCDLVFPTFKTGPIYPAIGG